MKIIKISSGFSIIEMVVALFITSLVLLGVVGTFQNFVSFNNWVVHSSYMQKGSIQDLVRFERAFENTESFIGVQDVSAAMQSVLGRDRDSVSFSYLSLVEDNSVGQQVSILDTDGHLALHQGVLFGGMVQVGGSLFVVDTGAHVIREVDIAAQTSSIYVGGNGQAGGVDGLGSLARFRNPTGIAYYNNQLYVSDTGNHAIRAITMNTNELLRSVATIAGNLGVSGSSDGLATQAFFNAPTGIDVNTDNGDIYVSDTGNHTIRKISSGFVTRVIGDTGIAGKGTQSAMLSGFLNYGLNTPTNIFYDEDFDILYINDFKNKRILKLREALDVKQITTRDVAYGGIGVYVDGEGKKHVLYQELLTGDIYGREYLDSLESLVFDAGSTITSFPSSGFLHQSFIKNGNMYYFWSLDASSHTWSVFQGDGDLDRLTYYFGNSGYFGNLKIFTGSDYIFSPLADLFGRGLVSYAFVRTSPAGYSSSLAELLLRYYFSDKDEDATELSYSLMLGDGK